MRKKQSNIVTTSNSKNFYIEWKNTAQKIAWDCFHSHDIVFVIGPAGSGKSFLSVAYAISEIIAKTKKKIVLTRPIVEAGENLGFLPGNFSEKVEPHIRCLRDCTDSLVGVQGPLREKIDLATEIAPLAYLRGRTLNNAVCILDEAQNCTKMQMKLFLTRLGENSKMIITGDPGQSDLRGDVALVNVVSRLKGVSGIGVIEFNEDSIVRHPLVSKILKELEN